MIEKMKKDKLKTATIIAAILVFVVGIVMTAVNSGDTYADSISDYHCTKSEYGPFYSDEYNYYCKIPSSEITSDSCKDLEEIYGFDYLDYKDDDGCYYSAIKNDATETVGSACYQCNSNSNLLKWSSSSPSTSSCPSGWNIYTATESSCKTYNISYDLKGGTGDISYQYKAHGVDVTVTNVTPTKSGYVFKGWCTHTGANTVDFKPGDTYDADASITLYAVYDVDSNSDENEVLMYSDEQVNCYSSKSSSSSIVEPSPWTDLCVGLWVKSTDDANWMYSTSHNCYVERSKLSETKPSSCSNSGDTTTETYTVKYDANGGTGAPAEQTKTEGKELTLSSTEPTWDGYTFLGWNTDKDATTAKYPAGGKYTDDKAVTLYAIWEKNEEEVKEYSIKYTLNGGVATGNPTTATYDKVVEIKNPSKTVEVVINGNKTDATIGQSISKEIEFDGWTSSDIDTKTAYYGDTAWKDGKTKVTDTKFKNLTAVGKTVTLVANWDKAEITLPTVVKEGYTCTINTKEDGKGTSYTSGGKYTINSNSAATVNLYAICEVNSKTDEEIDTNNKTGDALIIAVWAVGLGTLGYSVYYFMKRKNSL